MATVIAHIDKWVPVAVTLSDSVDNLLVNNQPYTHLHNKGTGGLVSIVWTDGTTASIYFSQGQDRTGGRWKRARVTDTAAGVELMGFK